MVKSRLKPGRAWTGQRSGGSLHSPRQGISLRFTVARRALEPTALGYVHEAPIPRTEEEGKKKKRRIRRIKKDQGGRYKLAEIPSTKILPSKTTPRTIYSKLCILSSSRSWSNK